MSSRLKNDCSNPPGRSILLKFSQIVEKKGKNKTSQSLGAIALVVSEWQLILWWCAIKIPPPPRRQQG